MNPIELGDGLVLRPVTAGDRDELDELIARNREHLAAWMPWAASSDRRSVGQFVDSAQEQALRDEDVQCAIVRDGRIAGVIGFHRVDREQGSASVGYWLAAAVQGRGLATRAVAAYLDHAFGAWDLHRVEIRANVENARSRAIPERLGFACEGVLREAQRLNGRYVNLVVYSILAREWVARRGADDAVS